MNRIVHITLCCLFITALTLNISDLSQTANFTARGGQELNVIVADFVEHTANSAEISLGALSTGILLYVESKDSIYGKAIQLVMITGHGWAVFHNEGKGWAVPIVVLPVVMVRW